MACSCLQPCSAASQDPFPVAAAAAAAVCSLLRPAHCSCSMTGLVPPPCACSERQHLPATQRERLEAVEEMQQIPIKVGD